MRVPHSPNACGKALHRAALPLAIALVAAVQPAQAAVLIANTLANDSYYNYNTVQGVTGSAGTSGGSVGIGIGGGDASSYSSYAGGAGNFAATSEATANANLPTGSLRASATSDGFYSSARAYARLDDTVTFHVAGASATTRTNVVINLILSGSISEFQSAGYLYDFKMFSSGSGASVGWTTQFYDSPSDLRNYVGWAVSGGAGEPSGFESWELLEGTATEKHFRGVLAVTGADKEYGLSTTFNLGCSGGTDCDFSHSANLTFDLPAGVTFTSGSGLLLTDVTAAVPEPGSLALVFAALTAVGWIKRAPRGRRVALRPMLSNLAAAAL